jgi:uracil permease
MEMETKGIDGYLPNDTPPAGKLILLGLQHVLTMFPATVFVAAFTGFHVGTVLLASGISTIVALVLSKNRIGTYIPLFYGSSFSYIAAYLGVAVLMTGDVPAFGQPLPNEVISTMQAGIVVTGVLNILVGFIVRSVGKDAVDRILPPVVTGSVAAIIGFSLAFAALGLAQANWTIALVVLFVTVLFSVYLQGRGFIGMLPILLGAVFGFLLAAVVDPDSVNMGTVTAAEWLVAPTITFPIFSGAFVTTAIVSIAIMAIATIPESTAHLYQISLYVDRFAEQSRREKSHLDKSIGWNLVFDGVGDFINGLLGATAGTNYGENNSLMAITRNYSGPALMMAGVFAILLGFVGKLAALVGAVPLAVTGGLSIYLFGVIGMQGIALMQEHHVSMFNPRNLAVGATIMVVGIGGHIGFDGFIPVTVGEVFPNGLPAIALAAVLGIVMNLIFEVFAPPEAAQIAETATSAAD